MSRSNYKIEAVRDSASSRRRNRGRIRTNRKATKAFRRTGKNIEVGA